MKKTGKEVKTPGVDVRQTSIRLQFTGPDGTRHRLTMKDAGGSPLQPTLANVRAAERTMTDIKAAIRIGQYDPAQFFPDLAPPTTTPTTRTLGDQLDKWISGLRVKRSTLAGYKVAVNFWKCAPADDLGTPIETVPLNELVFSQIRHALAVGGSRQRRGKVENESKPKPISGKTANNYLAVLRAALELAVDDGLIEKSPAGEGSKLRSKVQKEPPDPLTVDELLLVVAKIAERDKLNGHAAADYCDFWGNTGLRTSEINGLEWQDVDLRTGCMRIHQGLVGGEMESETKTHTARVVRLNARARAALERQRARTQLAGGLVWLNPLDGLPWDGARDFLRSHWRPALRALGIRYRRPYNLRHTFATMLLHAGVNPALAAKQMGHSQQMFFSTYARWIESDRDADELAKLDAMLEQKRAASGS